MCVFFFFHSARTSFSDDSRILLKWVCAGGVDILHHDHSVHVPDDVLALDGADVAACVQRIAGNVEHLRPTIDPLHNAERTSALSFEIIL